MYLCFVLVFQTLMTVPYPIPEKGTRKIPYSLNGKVTGMAIRGADAAKNDQL